MSFKQSMAKQIIVMGVSGSGKSAVGSRLASHLNYNFYDADDFHPPQNVEKMSRGIPLNDSDRIPWLQIIADFLSKQSELHTPSVVACSALKKMYRDTLRVNEHVVFVFLKGDKSIILPRLQARSDHFMPSTLLDSQLKTLEEPTSAISVSIEGTIDEIVKEIANNPEILND